MGRLDAFYLPGDAFAPPYALTGSEAHHCARVLRKAVGDRVRVFDGAGREGEFVVSEVARERVVLTPVSLRETPPETNAVWLAAGFSRSARRDFFLEKAVELGAAGIVFWQAARSQGRMPDASKEAWTATLVAAAKQCGAAKLPALDVVAGGAAGLAAAWRDRACRRYLLWEDADSGRRLCVADVAAPGSALFVLGPEGGLTEAEAALFIDAGFVPASLGERVLRWETAGLAVLALRLAG
ncbi:16S rRNA (uracil(1498)-N(3))-methyltransferase [Solidesulfovibrio sp.]|uniref:16S rRNA (uracil(1498)-N(3))-methyltransferase n=1 Tax=Solidesulfovibrio sp. TaxID=2910990 RepID=UPI00260ED548|nr:16S rRNA (uracil(1498)-N(3))-methyltransferase [Solidesulfovibrio sp.]